MLSVGSEVVHETGDVMERTGKAVAPAGFHRALELE